MSETLDSKLSCRIDSETVALLSQHADNQGISLSELVRKVLDSAVVILKLRGKVRDRDTPPSLFLSE